MTESELDLNKVNPNQEETATVPSSTEIDRIKEDKETENEEKNTKQRDFYSDSDSNPLVHFTVREDNRYSESDPKYQSQNNEDMNLLRDLNIPIELDPEYSPEAVPYDPKDLNVPCTYEDEESGPTDLSGIVKKLDIPYDSEAMKTELSSDENETKEATVTDFTRIIDQDKLMPHTVLNSKLNGVSYKSHLDPQDLSNKLDFRELTSQLDTNVKLSTLDLTNRLQANTNNLGLNKMDVQELSYKKYLESNEEPLTELKQTETKYKKKKPIKYKEETNRIMEKQSPLLKVAENQPLTVENWAQCENCKKWRRLPITVDTEKLPETWVCALNIWDPIYNSCKVPEELYPEKTMETRMQGYMETKGREEQRQLKVNSGSRNKYLKHNYHLNGGENMETIQMEEPYMVEREGLRTPTVNRQYEEMGRKDSSRRMSRINMSPLVSNLSSYDDECELIKFKMNIVNETNIHPLKKRLTLYSDNITTMLATELPHSALLLDNFKKMNLIRDDDHKDEEGTIITKEKDNIYPREDGNINLGYAYRTSWNHNWNRSKENMNNIRTKSESWRKLNKKNLEYYNDKREDITRMYSRLATQIPKIQDIAKLDEEEAQEMYNRTQNYAKSRSSTLSTTTSINAAATQQRGPTSNIVSKSQVLDLLYKFAKQKEPLLEHLEYVETNKETQEPVNKMRYHNDYYMDDWREEGEEKKVIELKNLLYCTKYKNVSNNLRNIIKYKEHMINRSEEIDKSEYEQEQSEGSQNEEKEDYYMDDVDKDEDFQKDLLEKELYEKEYLRTEKKNKNHHLDYPLPNIKQLSKRCRNLDNSDYKEPYENGETYREYRKIDKYRDLMKEKYETYRESYSSYSRDQSPEPQSEYMREYSPLFQPIPENVVYNNSSGHHRYNTYKDMKTQDIVKMLSMPITYNKYAENENFREKEGEKEYMLNHFDNINLLSLPIPELNSNGTNSRQYVIT